MAASASAAFVAADVGMALAHPTPANRAVVVGDALGLAIGYGAGKLIGAAVSKFGPTVAEMFAQRAAQKALQDADPATVYHFKGDDYVASVLKEINPNYFQADTRYGAGFYVAQQGETAIAEVTYHGGDPAAGKVIRYEMDVSKIKALDMSDPAIAKAYKVDEAFAHEHAVEREVATEMAKGGHTPAELQSIKELTKTKYAKFQEIGAKAQAEGYNAVKFPSVRGAGNNYVIYTDDVTFINGRGLGSKSA